MTDVTTTEAPENLSSRLQSDSAFSWGPRRCDPCITRRRSHPDNSLAGSPRREPKR
jgi:hypothetical protein